MAEAVRAAAIYARISDDHEGHGLGVARQVKECREEAERRSWPVYDTYVDNDRSAYRGSRRPEFDRMVEDLKAGACDAVIVWHQDRLTRSPRELEDFVDLYEAVGLAGFASVTGGTYDLMTGDGRFTARIQGAVARKESDDKSRRGRSKQRELAEAGKLSGGGTRPFGYDRDFHTIVPAEAAVIREAAKRVLAGESVRSVTADLNDRGVPTVKGGRWSPVVLRGILVSARIAGQRSLHGEVIAKAEWKGIISVATSERLKALLLDPERRTSRPVRRYALAGLLHCSKCNTVLVSRPRPDGTRRYVCPTGEPHNGCGGCAVLADPIERLIAELVLYRLDSAALARSMQRAQRTDDAAEGASTELKAALARQDELAAMFATGEINRREWLTAREPIEKRVQRAQQQVTRLSRTPIIDEYVGHADRLRRNWDGLNLDRQRAIIAAVLDHAIVGPAVRGRKTFDPSRVTPVWRR